MSFEKLARRSQSIFDPFVAMIYFAPEAFERYKVLGLKRWPGYFCSRSAAIGRVPSQVIAATFYNWNPAFVIEAVETGWASTTPELISHERFVAVGEALQRLLAPIEGEEDLLENVGRAIPLVKQATAHLPFAGRTLFAAHHALPWPEDPLLALWNGLNMLREYRGDSHIVALMAEGVRPLESLLFQAAYSPRLPLIFLLQSRAWAESDVAAAQKDLAERGLVQDGVLTEAGAALRERVEQITDRLDTAPFEALGEASSEELLSLVEPLSRRIVAHGGLQRK